MDIRNNVLAKFTRFQFQLNRRVRSKSFSAESSSNDGDNDDVTAHADATNHRLTLLRSRETDDANNQEASAAKIDFVRQVW